MVPGEGHLAPLRGVTCFAPLAHVRQLEVNLALNCLRLLAESVISWPSAVIRVP
jgi:hypothetical protein